MADERDPQVSRRYRELGAEEPPRALDEAILAASRQAVAPRRRWYLPLAAAAVALLAVGIALQMDRQEPGPEAVPSATVTEPKALRRQAPPASPARQEQGPSENAARDAAAPGERALGATAGRRADESRARQSAPEAAPIPQTAPARPAPPAAALAESHERWLERIAQLRMQGRHDDADKALAEFRKRYPEYRIPESMLEKLERDK